MRAIAAATSALFFSDAVCYDDGRRRHQSLNNENKTETPGMMGRRWYLATIGFIYILALYATNTYRLHVQEQNDKEQDQISSKQIGTKRYDQYFDESAKMALKQNDKTKSAVNVNNIDELKGKRKNKYSGAVKYVRNDKLSPLFHQVLTTGTQYLSIINVRSIESIFYVYPNARLHLHYNKKNGVDLKHPMLSPLLNTTYNITLLPYDPATQLQLASKMSTTRDKKVNSTLAHFFIKGIKPKYSKEKFWFSNEANLLRLCLLYTVGGTYLDTDVILIKKLDNIENAVAGSKGKSIHCAVLRFTKPGNVYLSAAINNFLDNYNGEKWGNNGPSIFRRTAQDNPDMICPGEVGLARSAKPKDGRCYVNILPPNTFAPVRWRQWDETCSKPGSSPVDAAAEAIMKDSYAVHLNNQVTGPLLSKVGYVRGSLCHMILTKYCNICS